MSKKWKRVSMASAGSSIQWSNVDYKLQDFIKNFPPPQVVRVKKDGGKSTGIKSSTELVLHQSKAVKKVEACLVSDGKQFVIPYDCPAKVYQLLKAEEYRSLGELRKAWPTSRYFLVTSSSSEPQLKEVEPGDVFTIIFKKIVNGREVFTCQRKKTDEILIPASAVGGFAAMSTTQEKKISDFVRHYSTFPIGIGIGRSTLANKSFGVMTQLVSQAKSGLIRLTKLSIDNTVIASSIGRKKVMYCIPKSVELTVTAPKALLLESAEHAESCKQLHGEVDSALTERHLSLAISTNTESEVTQWAYGEESTYDEVVPLQKVKSNGEAKHIEKIAENKTTVECKENSKGKAKEKLKEKQKPKEKEKEEKEKKEKDKVKDKGKDKGKDKNNKEKRRKISEEKPSVQEQRSNEDKKQQCQAPQDAADLVEDDSGYLIPAELLKAEKENMKTKEGDQESAESKEKAAKASTFGRLMDRVKGKDKKKDRPMSGVLDADDAKAKSASMPAQNTNHKKTPLTKNKAKTLSTADIVVLHPGREDIDGSTASLPETSSPPAPPCPEEKEVKKRDKGLFSTAGKKAGAKLRNKLNKSKATEDQNETTKPDSPTSKTSSPPSPSNEDLEQDMYVAPVDDQLSHRPLPPKPPEETDRKISTMSIPYDNDDLYDEINPTPEKQFKIPKDLSKLNVDGVCDVLRCLNMSEHVPKFRRDQIDGEIFKSLDDRLLGALGVGDPIQRLKLKKLIKGWRPKN